MTKQILHYEIRPVKVTCRVTEYRGYIYDQMGELVDNTELYLYRVTCENRCIERITELENRSMDVLYD